MPLNRALERYVSLVYEGLDVFCDLRQVAFECRDRAPSNLRFSRHARRVGAERPDR